MASKPDRDMSEAAANKYANVDGKQDNGGNYQRALTLLNEVVILTSPATATDASDHQPQLSQQSNLQLQYKFQVLLKGKKWLFPFYRQGATAAGIRTSSRQPCKRFCPSASAVLLRAPVQAVNRY